MGVPARTRWGASAALLLPLIAVLGFLGWATLRHQQSLQIGAALARGEMPPAPSVALPAFDGRKVSLEDLRGHPVILNFWASWCVPCREEAPILEAIWGEFRTRGVIVVGVDTQDLETPARRFLTQHGITYLNVRDPDGHVAHLFGTTGVPETFFIGRDGRIRGKFPGEQPDRSVWRAAAAALLAGSGRIP
ncbi:MAG TPA: redoxin domain-containing protein [bacterium]|nr:redoxin domain-containing protein [bacterium]